MDESHVKNQTESYTKIRSQWIRKQWFSSICVSYNLVIYITILRLRCMWYCTSLTCVLAVLLCRLKYLAVCDMVLPLSSCRQQPDREGGRGKYSVCRSRQLSWIKIWLRCFWSSIVFLFYACCLALWDALWPQEKIMPINIVYSVCPIGCDRLLQNLFAWSQLRSV